MPQFIPLRSSNPYLSVYSDTDQFWSKIRNAAATQKMDQHLPQDYRVMNEAHPCVSHPLLWIPLITLM